MLINQNQITVNGISGTPLTADANGRVGIGTTTPSETVHIKGDGARLYIDSDDYHHTMIGRRGSSGADLDRGYLRLKDAATNKVALDTAGPSYLNGGDVGIGTETPNAKLDVHGHVFLKGGADQNKSGTTYNWNSNNYARFETDGQHATGAELTNPTIYGPNKLTIYDDPTWVGGIGLGSGEVSYFSGDRHKFYRHTGSALTTLMEIDSNGYVSNNNPHIFGTPHNGSEASSGVCTYMHVKTSRGLSFSNNRVTVPVSGVYMITYQTICQTNTGRYDTRVKINGNTVSSGLNENNGDGYHQRTHVFNMYLNANDYVQWENTRHYSSGSQYTDWVTGSVTKIG